MKRIIGAVCVLALTILACIFLYRYDNKYTAPGPRGMEGSLLLGEPDVTRCTFLIDDWAVYGGVLLMPEDFIQNAPKPDGYVFIGQHGGFEKLAGSPHGSVTYRLVIGIPEGLRSYTLALPEIFSSCRVYVNGIERLALGETDPARYRFETGNAVITFDAAEKIDLLIAVSDFSHLYSGMVYPPAIGTPDAVFHMLNTRFALRTALCAAALIIGAASLSVGLLGKHKGLAVLYGLLCLLFAGYICYPVTMTLTRGTALFYAVENVSFCAMLLVIIALQDRISRVEGWARGIRPYILGFGIFVCLTALAMPPILPRASLSLMMAYSNLIMVYQWVTAGYITVMAGLAVWENSADSSPLFLGMLVLDCTLVMDRVLNVFEPVLSGWFPELGSAVLVLSVGVAAEHEVIRQFRENAVLDERVRIIISSGREYYQKITDMYDTMRILRHDYKYHLSTIRELLGSGERDKIDDYLTGIETQMSENELQSFCKNQVINALLSSYAERCAKLDIRYEVKISMPDTVLIPDYEMCIILGNLLENAIEACRKQGSGRKIELHVTSRGEQLGIRVVNSFGGKIIEDKGRLISSKTEGGLGLRSIQSIAARYDGELITEWDNETFTAYVLMRL